MKRIIIALAFVCVCIVLSDFSNNVEADVVRSEKQLRVEVKKNLLSILAKGVKAKEVVEEIAKKSNLKIRIFGGVEDKEISLDVSDIPVYDVEALLKKVGYDNVAVVYDKTAKAVSAYVLPKGMDASVFVKDNPVIRQANFSTSAENASGMGKSLVKGHEIITVEQGEVSVRYVRDEVLLKPAPYLSDKEIKNALKRYDLVRVSSPMMKKIGYVKAKVQDGRSIEDVMREVHEAHCFVKSEPNYVLNSLLFHIRFTTVELEDWHDSRT